MSTLTLFNTCMVWIQDSHVIQSQYKTTLSNMHITDFGIAYDIVILFESLETLVVALDTFSNEIEPLDLEISYTKNKDFVVCKKNMIT